MALDELVRLRELYTPDEIQKRNDLSGRVTTAFNEAVKSFLVKKHKADEQGNPLHSYLGTANQAYQDSESDAEALFRHIGIQLIPYMFPEYAKNPEKIKEKENEFKKHPEHYDLFIASAIGIDLKTFKQKIMKSSRNITEATTELATAVGSHLPEEELREMEDKIYRPENIDEIYGEVKKHLPKGKDVDKKDPRFLYEAKPLLRQLYTDHLARRYTSVRDAPKE